MYTLIGIYLGLGNNNSDQVNIFWVSWRIWGTNFTLWITLNIIFPPLKCSFLKHLWDLLGVGKITNKIVREVIAITVVNNITGTKTYLLKYKEAYIVATSEMEGANWLPRDAISHSNELQQVLCGVGKKSIGKEIKHNSTQRYARRFVKQVNKEE